MSNNGTLTIDALLAESDPTVSSKFWAFHSSHPDVYDWFKKLTKRAIEKGFKNYSAKGIIEQIRWETKGTIKEDGFKVNNNYTALYARMFETEHPQHKGFFRKRKLRANY